MLYEYQQKATYLALSQTQEPKVFVDPEYKWISIGKERMYMEKLRSGIQELLNDLESRYLQLTRGNLIVKHAPDDFDDDLNNTNRSYSFVCEEPFHSKRNSLFLYLVEEYNLAFVDGAGSLSWNIPKVKDLLAVSSQVWEPLYHLLYLTSHISTRGTQFIEHQIANADRHRNFFVQGGEVFILTGYSKKTNTSGLDSCIPGFLPKPVAKWVLELVGGGLRNAEAILGGIAYGEESEHFYKTCVSFGFNICHNDNFYRYLCVANGARMTADQFSSKIPAWNQKYFGCRWGLRDFRQGAITMGREFISPVDHFGEVDSILAESADHSVDVDHAHYAVVHGAIPRLTNNALWRQRWFSNQWGSLLGLGPFPPPKAIRLVRNDTAIAKQDLDLQAVSDRVAQVTSDILKAFSQEMKEVIYQSIAAAFKEHQGGNQDSGGDVMISNVHDIPSQPSPFVSSPRQASSPSPSHRLLSSPSTSSVMPPPSIIRDTPPSSFIPPLPSLSPEVLPKSATLKVPNGTCTRSLPQSSNIVPTSDPLERSPARIQIEDIQESSHRSLKRSTPHVSETDTIEEPSRSSKRQCGPKEKSSLFGIDYDLDMPSSLPPSSSHPLVQDVNDTINIEDNTPSPSPPVANQQTIDMIRSAIRTLRKDPTAKEKSRQQLEALLSIISVQKDLLITMKTGGGKSLLWMVPSELDKKGKSIVVCPFAVLLDEQYTKTAATGLRCHHYGHSKDVPNNVQILFVQVEHCASSSFAS